MKNMGAVIFSFICISAILVAGCVGPQISGQQSPTATTTANEVTTKVTLTPIITTTPRSTTTTPAIKRTTQPRVEAFDSAGNSVPIPEAGAFGPMAAPVTLTGVGNDIVWFEAVHPGVVTIKMRNGFGSQVVKNCEEKYFRVDLAGKSIDSAIYDKGMALSTVTRTATIPSEGRYSLTVKSCGQWEITIDNA